MRTVSMLQGVLLWGLMASAAAAPPALRLGDADIDRLLAIRSDLSDTVTVAGAPEWALTPMDAYAPDARIEQEDGPDRRELPRSSHRLFRISNRLGSWLGLLVLDARGAFVEATVFGDTAIYRGENVVDSAAVAIEFRDLAQFLPAGVELKSSCDMTQAMSPAVLPSLAPQGASARAHGDSPSGALVQARLAIDTDNEFMAQKFANNTANANNYVVALIGLMSVIYERDLGVRLTIGTSILRTAADPYAATGASTFAQLNEFGEFWRVNQAGVARAFALQLSGKSSSPNSASGIAWVLNSGNYCTSTGTVFMGDTSGHYGVNQVFKFSGATAASDVSLVAHELGHNFGANHTHCTDVVPGGSLQPIDMCFNAEGGCYAGAVACPIETAGQGTLMSYCNFGAPSGANCGAVRQEFHPFHITQLSGRVLTNTQNGCFAAVAASDNIFGNGFE